MNSLNNYCVIVCGGSGTRLWPLSKESKPKQFLDLFGLGKSMLQLTYERIARLLPKENIFISTYVNFSDIVKEQLPDMEEKRIVTDPLQLGTAPATALTVSHIYGENPNANILITPADQIIFNEEEFHKQVDKSLQFVENSERFVVIGVKPTRPETSYGYIQIGKDLGNSFATVKSFTEKPNAEFATLFCESGEFYWSTGIFVFNANYFGKCYAESHPAYAKYLAMIDRGASLEERKEFVNTQYPRTLFSALDMFILEHCSNVNVCVCSFGWADIGAWDNLFGMLQKTPQNNAILNTKTELYNCHNNIISLADGRILVAKGLENYMIVENEQVLVICPKNDPSLLRRMRTDVKMKYGDIID